MVAPQLLQNMAASEDPNPGAQALRVFPVYVSSHIGSFYSLLLPR